MMAAVNYWAVLVGAAAAFVLSFGYYSVLGNQLSRLSDAYTEIDTPPSWKILVEFLRSLAVASVMAGLAAQIGITTWSSAALLGLSLWIGFPLAILVGSALWENVPVRLAAIHTGDWLIKLLVIAVVVSLWRSSPAG